MKKLIYFLLLLISSCSGEKTDNWNLVWSDEFEEPGLPSVSDWVNETGFIRNNELQYYTERRIENTEVKDGNLMIIGRKEPWIYNNDTADYTSASITTDGKRSWTYGKIEARIKLPEGQGLWPAFWMLGQNIHQAGWPKCGEIDIMEHINKLDIVHGTLHWDNNGHVSSGDTIACNVTDYHIYSVEWNSNSIKWLLDGKEYHVVNVKDSVNNTEEFQKPHYIILNLAIGGEWPKNPDETTVFPDTVFVDYVRVYQKNSN
ncbi:MAG TPA: glycoside hydrolase family 16 protein [Bacteroidales bacterium]|nr:glycoside hydrolase family 16 protein [Bacteroidales bacterium]